MLVRRFYDDRLAQASYLIACQDSHQAIVIDPARDITPYLAAAKSENVRIAYVTETHIHADFVSGSRELAQRTGAELLLSGAGEGSYGHRIASQARMLHDGDRISLGGVRIDVWHTPGHTPEHIAFLVTDVTVSEEPVALVSGDFLFVGDVGRPDLLEKAAGVANTATIGARALWQSLQRLGSLPEHLQIWPGHGAGSSCGKALGALPTSTLGYERRTNWALGVHDENTFVRSVLADQPDPPPYFGTMKRVNRDGPEIVGELAALPELTADQLALELPRSVVIDLRPAKAYAETHIPGTLNLAFNKAFTKWAGWLVSNDQDVFLIAENPAMAEEARRALLAIGLDRVRGMTTTAAAAALMRGGTALASRRMSMKHVAELAAAGRHIIDVRDDHEWADGHVPGAEHHSLGRVQESLRNLDRATPVAVHCQGGGRSAIAASVLERMGFKDIVDLSDGWSAFEGNR